MTRKGSGYRLRHVEDQDSFEDREVDAIIARAAELARGRIRSGNGRTGAKFRLAELERIASEVGIAPEHVRHAARELRHRAPKPHPLAGRIRFEEFRDVPGPVDEETLHRLAMDLPDIAGTTGHGTAAGRSLVWRSDGVADLRMGRKTRIEIHASPAEDDGTLDGEGDSNPAPMPGESGTSAAPGTAPRVFVRVSQDLSPAAGGIYGGLVGGLGIGIGMGVGFGVGLGALGSAAAAMIIFALSVAGSYGFARLVYAVFAAEAGRRGVTVADDIVRRIAGARMSILSARTVTQATARANKPDAPGGSMKRSSRSR